MKGESINKLINITLSYRVLCTHAPFAIDEALGNGQSSDPNNSNSISFSISISFFFSFSFSTTGYSMAETKPFVGWVGSINNIAYYCYRVRYEQRVYVSRLVHGTHIVHTSYQVASPQYSQISFQYTPKQRQLLAWKHLAHCVASFYLASALPRLALLLLRPNLAGCGVPSHL